MGASKKHFLVAKRELDVWLEVPIAWLRSRATQGLAWHSLAAHGHVDMRARLVVCLETVPLALAWLGIKIPNLHQPRLKPKSPTYTRIPQPLALIVTPPLLELSEKRCHGK